MNTSRLHPKYSLEELLENASFRKWAKGNATEEQKIFWDQWIESSTENRELAKKAQEKIVGFSIKVGQVQRSQKALRVLNKKLEENSRLRKVKGTGFSSHRGLQWVWRFAAAVLLIAVTGWTVHSYYDELEPVQDEQYVKHEVKTDYNERKSISLSDGSEIVLNAHSTLIYKTSNQKNYDIEVYLEGEAFFSVTKRTGQNSSPFKVRTAAGKIQVMGTEFVVTARNSKTRVVLTEGSVAVDAFKQSDKVLLKPGQMAEFDTSWDIVRTKMVNPEVYTSWRTRILVFDRTPLAEVIDRLEYTFGVNVIVRDPDLFEQRITGSIENAGLEVITSALSSTLDTSVKISDETVYLGN